MIITSNTNEQIKNLIHLKDKSKARKTSGTFIVEGIKLVEEAIQENADIKQIVVCDDDVQEGNLSKEYMYKIAKYDCIYVTAKVFKRRCSTC